MDQHYFERKWKVRWKDQFFGNVTTCGIIAKKMILSFDVKACALKQLTSFLKKDKQFLWQRNRDTMMQTGRPEINC